MLDFSQRPPLQNILVFFLWHVKPSSGESSLSGSRSLQTAPPPHSTPRNTLPQRSKHGFLLQTFPVQNVAVLSSGNFKPCSGESNPSAEGNPGRISLVSCQRISRNNSAENGIGLLPPKRGPGLLAGGIQSWETGAPKSH
ncbi:Hypothetical predicted protein [Podarcis lilfordi]|uniref:Uncharacterized protein n=1 Tax=Podarcis lilfordi TaxID=74358 RepID=A0AA35LLX3_9SAUR|nr:Hypothetical predicted protein [Podarcis lilfordi]